MTKTIVSLKNYNRLMEAGKNIDRDGRCVVGSRCYYRAEGAIIAGNDRPLGNACFAGQLIPDEAFKGKGGDVPLDYGSYIMTAVVEYPSLTKYFEGIPLNKVEEGQRVHDEAEELPMEAWVKDTFTWVSEIGQPNMFCDGATLGSTVVCTSSDSSFGMYTEGKTYIVNEDDEGFYVFSDLIGNRKVNGFDATWRLVNTDESDNIVLKEEAKNMANDYAEVEEKTYPALIPNKVGQPNDLNLQVGDIVKLVLEDDKHNSSWGFSFGQEYIVKENRYGLHINFAPLDDTRFDRIKQLFEVISRSAVGEAPVGTPLELHLREGDIVEMVEGEKPEDHWSFVPNAAYTVKLITHDPVPYLTINSAPIFKEDCPPIKQLFKVVSRSADEVPNKETEQAIYEFDDEGSIQQMTSDEIMGIPQTKKLDHNTNQREVYNVSGWGNDRYVVALQHQDYVADFTRQKGTEAAGKHFNIASSTAWRVMQLVKKPAVDSIFPYNDYDKDFRMRTCMVACKYGAYEAADIMGCSVGSVYNWLKAYDMTNHYFNPSITASI